jgi:hypothetical protein
MNEEPTPIPTRTWEEQQEHEKRAFEAALITVDKLIEMDFRTYDDIRLKTEKL